ncbi:MAG TPA: hypothetical protein VH540_12625 [Ktedonobacterales bacterium]
MSVQHTTNYEPLLDAIVSTRATSIAKEVVHLLKNQAPPFFIIGQAGIPAAWGDSEGSPLCALAAGGHLADWARSIPASAESATDENRLIAAALPLTQALVLAAPAVKAGHKSHATLSDPIFPANITHGGSMLGALKEAVSKGQTERTIKLLLGYYATGTDYRSYLANVYQAFIEHDTGDGRTLIYIHRSSQVLDMAGWADKLPPFIHWLTPHLATTDAQPAFVAEVQAFLSAQEHSLDFLRTRLSPAKNTAADAKLLQTILQGSLEDTCNAIFAALKEGAHGPAVGSVIALAAARRYLDAPESDSRELARHGVLLAGAARTAVAQLQEVEVLPLLFLVAAAINTNRPGEQSEAQKRASSAARAASGTLAGGLIASSLLRSLERQLEDGEEAAAEISARRYLQQGHPARGLVATIASVASQGDATSDQGQTLLLTLAAGEEYLALPPHLHTSEGEALLSVAIRAAIQRPQERTVAEAVRTAAQA